MTTERTAGTCRYAAEHAHPIIREFSWLGWPCIALVGLLCMVAGTALYPFFAPDEARHAGIVHDMWAARHFLMPRVNGFPTLDGAPLHYWLSLAFVAVFGAHEWVLRLPSALAAVALLMLIGKVFVPASGRRMPVVLAVLFLLQPALHLAGRFASPDLLSLLLLAASLGGFLRATQRLEEGVNPSLALCGAWLATALLGLSAGVLAVPLPIAAVLFWLTLRRRFDLLMSLRWLWGLVILAVLLLPWWLMAEQSYPGIALAMLQKQALSLTTHGRHGWLELGHGFCRLLVFLGGLPLMACLYLYLQPGKQALLRTPTAGLMSVWLLLIVPFHSLMVVSPAGHVAALVVPLLYFGVLAMTPQDARWSWREARAWIAPVLLALALAAVGAHFLAQRISVMKPVTKFLSHHYNALTDKAIMLERYDYDFNFHMRSPKLVSVATDWNSNGNDAPPFWKQAFSESARFVPETASRILLQASPEAAPGKDEPGTSGAPGRLLERVCDQRAINLWVIGLPGAEERYPILSDATYFADPGGLRIWYLRAGRDPATCVSWAQAIAFG